MRPNGLLASHVLALTMTACAPAPVTPAPAGTCPPCAATPTPTPTSSTSTTPPTSTSTSTSTTPTTTTTSAPPPSPTPPAAPPAALTQSLDAALEALSAHDFPSADKELAAATSAADSDPHFAYAVARLKAARFATAGDFEHAAAAYLAVIPMLASHPELDDEFWSHNAMMMIREAQGDPAAALAENDQATLAAARGTWDPKDRETLAFMKDRWHRAYLTRMLAESRTGSAKEALVRYAQAALDEYRAKGGYPDSVAILDAYFAALDGKGGAALAAAKRVDATKDDDIEDLYLVVVGLAAGGDRAATEAVRAQMRQPGYPGVARAVMLRWIDLDEHPGRGFTPLHAHAR